MSVYNLPNLIGSRAPTLTYIINNKQYVVMSKRSDKRTHEIDPPVKNFYHLDWV